MIRWTVTVTMTNGTFFVLRCKREDNARRIGKAYRCKNSVARAIVRPV